MEKTKRIKEKKSVFSENDMANNVCKSCGANLVYRNGRWVCPACGLFKEEELSNEEVTLLYNAEQKLRLASFDDAEDLYKDIIKKYPENAQGYWGLLLAKYGIKYEVDYDGTEKPTCYAVTIESVQSDPNYQKVLDLCKDKEEKRSYIDKAKEIDRIRVEWLEKASKEPQYDIFICYKDSDKTKDIDRTDDSWDVADLYHHLKDLGYKVFYSRESLREKASEKWEPYIYQAINTASVMLVYGSKVEYFESTWMKNEWTRYFRRMREGKKVENSLLVAYAGKDPENLPKPLNAIQIMDAGRKTFYGDLEKQIARIIAIVRKPKITVEKIVIKGEVGKKKTEVEGKKVEIREIGRYDVPVLTPSDATKLKTAQKMLANGLFDQALKTTEEVIEKNPQNGQALLLQFLADRKIVSIDKLSSIEESELNQIEKIIEYIDKKSGEALLSKVAELINFTKEHQETLVAFVLQYNFVERDNYINKWIEELITNPSVKDSDKSFTEILNYIDKKDIDTHISLRFRYAEMLRQRGYLDRSKRYYEEVVAIDESHLGARWGIVCCEIHYSGTIETLGECITAIKSYDSLENLFRYCENKTKQAYLDRLISAVSEATRKDSAVIKIFDRLIQYYTEEENNVLLKKVSGYAHLCQELGLFENAEKYYALTISLDDHNQDGYWGLMQAKLKCRTNDDLIKQPVPISEMSEFSSAIAAAGEDDRSTDRYIALAKAQVDYQKEQEEKKKKQRKIKKRISIIAVAVALVIAMIITTVSVVSVEKKKASLNYFAVDNGYSVVAGEKYKEKVARISATYNGSSVTEIADNAFADNAYLEKVVIPASVTKIGKNAFAGCISLEEVVFAQNDMVAYADSGERVATNSNVTFVGENAFEGCKKLRKIDLQNATQIEKSAFRGCESLTSIELSQSLETLQKDTFRGCRSLRTIELPENLIRVEDGCFAGCETLQEISIPASVTNLGEAVFSGCTELKTIALDSENTFDEKWTEGLTNARIGVTVYLDYNDAKEKNGQDKVIISTGEYYTLPIPTKEGYTFIGWFTARTNGEKVATAKGNSLSVFKASSKLTYYARFVPNVNTIVFDENGGSGIMQAQSAETDSTITLKANGFTKDGYSFAGWGTTKYSVDYSDGASYRMGTAPSYTLYAIWTANQNVLAFDANGGEGTMENILVYTDATATLSETLFTKKGYKFIGWAKTADGNVEFEDKASYTMGTLSEYTLYAIWEIETYTITYDLGGGTANNKTSYTILTETFQIENPTKTGYEFIGWTGTGLSDTTMTLSMPQGSTGNKSFTANWIGNQNTLSFNANNGEGQMNDMIIRSGESAALLQNSFTRKGYDFVGWALVANGEVTYEDKDNYEMGISSENTLYAVWTIINYTLSYDLNKGTLTESNRTSYTVETDTFTFNEPERAGYTFTGWTGTELNSATKNLSIEKGSIGNRAYTANWQANLNKLSLHANGGEGNMDEVMIHTDETVSLPANQFTRKGYTFAGWSIATAGETGYNDEDEYTMGTNAEYHLYAHWSIITYTLTYELNNGTVASNKTSFTVETTTFTINNPYRSGYEFIGWTGTGLNEETITVTIEKGSINNRSYVANWQANLNTLSFNANGGDGNMDDMQIRTDETAKLSPNLFTKTGYHFVGWARTNYGAVAFEDEDNYTMGSSSQYNLYAKWEPNSNTLAFYGNGSTYGVMEPIQINTDTTVSLPVCSYEKEGYSFIGWATSALGDIAYIDQAEYTMGTDPSYSLYAKWQINQYTITIEPNGGAVNKSSITQDYNTVVTAPTISRTGYDFVDWYEDSDFKVVYNFATMQAKDVMAYAKWQMKTTGDQLTGIRTPQELQDINTHLDGNFYLENDIDMTGFDFVPIGLTEEQKFTGSFDGKKKDISYLTISGNYNVDKGTYVGLFGFSQGTIQNVYIQSANYTIDAKLQGVSPNLGICIVGGIVGWQNTQTITDCSWNGAISVTNGVYNSKIGGMVGYGSVERCMTSGSITTDFDALIGGMAGNGTVRNCYVNINIYSGKHTGTMSESRSAVICSNGSIINSLAGAKAFNDYSWTLASAGPGGQPLNNQLSQYNSHITKSYQQKNSSAQYYLDINDANSRIYMTQTAGWDESIWCFGYGYPVLYGRDYIRVIYNNVDGLNNDANPSGFKLGSDGFTLASITKTGYTFGGWYLDNEYTQPISKVENLTEITNIYAKWTPNTYTVTLNPVGGTVNEFATVTFDAPYILEIPVRAGYTFDGWYDGTGNTAVQYTDETGNSLTNWTIDNNDVILYAKWHANLNTIIFNGNGSDSGVVTNITGYTDEYVRLPINNYQKTDFEFKGWSLSQNGDIVYYDRDLYLMGSNSSYTLYAQWKEVVDRTGWIPISTVAELNNISNNLSGKYYLTCDLDMKEYDWYPIGYFINGYRYGEYMGSDKRFYGEFDGNGYIIYNLSSTRYSRVNTTYQNYHEYITIGCGLFGYNKGTIKNVTIINADLQINAHMNWHKVEYTNIFSACGGVVCSLNEGQIINCSVQGTIDFIFDNSNNGGPFEGGSIAGICGVSDGVVYCDADVSITSSHNVTMGYVVPNIENSKYLVAKNDDSLFEGYIKYALINGEYRYQFAKWHSIVNALESFDSKAGYNLSGWALSDGGEKEYDVGDEVFVPIDKKNLILYPVWTANTNAIVFNNNGGSGTMNDQQIQTDSSASLNANIFTKDGYHFVGWATEPNGVVKYKDCAMYTMGTQSSYTLYARWTANTNQIIFMPNGGNGAMINQEALTDTNITLNACSFTPPTGCHFAGWAVDPNGEIEYTDCASYRMGVNSSYTLYAKWDYNQYTVTLNPGNGTVVNNTTTVTYASTYTIEIPTSPLGYDFLGWFDSTKDLSVAYTDNEGNSLLSWTIDNNNIILFARYITKDEMSNLRFNSTVYTCTVTGVEDKTVTEIVVPDYVTNINKGAFSGCSSLENITIPFVGQNIESSYPFGFIFGTINYDGSGAVYQDFNGSINGVDGETYYIPMTLTNVTILGGTLFYGDFYWCNTLTTITLPPSAKDYIGAYAFYNCSNLTDIYYPGTVSDWYEYDSNMFRGTNWDYGTGDYIIHCTNGDIEK